MPTNPFDILDQTPSQNYGNDNPFDIIDERDNENREKLLRQTLINVSKLDPERTGAAQKLAERLNLPSNLALDSEETIEFLKERNKEKDIYEMDMAQTNPILMRHLTDPNFAVIAQDNVEKLSLIENAFTAIQEFPDNVSQGFETGRLEAESGKLGTIRAINNELGKSNEAINKRLEEINLRLAELQGDGSGMWENTASIVGQWSRTLQESVKYGTAGAGVGAGLGTFGGPFAPITVKGGAITGFIWGLTTGSAKEGTIIEAGHQYNQLLENGISHETAKNVGIAVGLVNGGLELVGLGTVTGPAKQLLIRATMKEVNKSLQKATMRQVLQKTGTIAFRNWASEVTTEELQELVNIAGEDFAEYFESGEFESKLQTKEGRQEIAQRLAAVFEKVGTGMIPLAGFSAGPTFFTDRVKAREATKDSAFIESLANLSVNDKTKIRNPNKFQNYIQDVADGKDVPNIFIDAKPFNQALKDNGITMEQLELFSPQIANDLKDINGTGENGDIVISTGEYATKIVGTDLGNALQPHIRVREDSFSATEAGVFESEKETLKQQAEQIINEDENKTKELIKDAQTVQENITRQLKETKVYRPNQIKYLSTLVRDFAVVQANKLGVKPSEFFSQYFYNITTEDKFTALAEQQLFNQDGTVKTESPAFKKFFGNSVLKNNDGTPQVVYHGTTDSISEFKLDHPHRLDSGWLGTGVYVTDQRPIAEYYTNLKKQRIKSGRLPPGPTDPIIMPLYVRLENPYDATQEDKNKIKTGQITAQGFRDQLIAQGYDGAIMPGQIQGVREIVVFDPKAVKSTENSGTWRRDLANIYKQLKDDNELFSQRGKQKQGKPVPQAVYQVANIVENFDFASTKPFATIKDFKIEIQDRVNSEAKKGKVDLSQPTVEVEKYLVQTLLADAQYALQENPNAIGWYNEKVTKAKRLLAKVHPELNTDAASNFAFTWALATSSNGINVNKNFELAEDIYSYWKQNGKFPTPYGQGKAGRAMTRSFKLINRLIEEKGIKDVEEFMSTTHTVKEVETYTGATVRDFGKTEIVYGAAVIGPKIGNGFFANLYGNYEQLTLDRWAMRMWGRMTGTLVEDKTKQAKAKRDQLKQYIKSLTKKQKKEFETILGRKLTLGDLDAVAKRIETRTTIPANVKLMSAISLIQPDNNVAQVITEIKGKPIKGEPRIGIGDEIRKAGNSLAGYLDGQKEQPKGPPERRFIEKIFGQVLPVLQQQNPDLTMADLQALMWYPEKKLYDTAKLKEEVVETGYEDNAAPDYANAAATLVATMGIPEAEIQSTLQEVDNELSIQSEEQSGDTQRDDGGSGIVRGTDTFQQQGRIDETTGLPLNADGTVTVFHHTNRRAAERIRATGELRSAGEPDVYVTTRAITDTGYGDTAVAIRIDPSRLSRDDEFPNGRKDFRLAVGKPRGSIQVDVGEFLQQSSEGARGQFDPVTLTTILTQEADFSTFLHETAHYMLTVMEDIAMSGKGSEQQVNDFQTLLDFFGVKDIQTWSNLSLDEKRKYHESFAYNYEIYLFEGKAPNTKLQEIFNEFQKFLKRIYKSIRDELNNLYRQENGTDLPILTDEIRGVMDRMIATEEQITQAESIYGMKPMFQTQEESNMDDATWKEYTDALKQAQEESMQKLTQASMRQVKWLGNGRDKYIKNLQRDVAKTRKKVMEQETNKLEKEKLYKLQAFLKRGEFTNDQNERVVAGSGFKIEKKSLENLLPFADLKSEIQQLQRKRLTAKEGMPVNVIAEMFGFKDPIAMINELIELRPIKEVAMERTDERMLNEFSDLTDPRQQEIQFQEAIHNEARARFLSVELRFLSKSMQPVRYQVAAARQVAKELLAKKRLRDIKPSTFSKNETKAANNVFAAMKKADTLEAIKAKKSQLLNNQLAKESLAILKTFDDATKLFDKIFQPDKKLANNKYNTDLVNAAKSILAAYQLGPAVDKPSQYTEKLQAYNPDMYEQLRPLIEDLTRDGNQDIKNLTYEKFETLYDAIQTLWFQARRDRQVEIDGKVLDLEVPVNELLETMARMKTPEQLGVTESPKGFTFDLKEIKRTRFFRAMQQGKSMTRRIEHWADGMDGATRTGKGLIGSVVLERDGVGAFTKYIWRPVKDALNKYRIERSNYTKRYTQMIGKLDLGKGAITSGELGFTFGNANGGYGKVEILGAMLHTGNASNLRKLLLGRGWGDINEDGSLNTSRWDTFVNRMIDEQILTEQDFKFLQDVWDLNEEIKPLIQESHRKIYGYYFKEVDATPIVNRFGSFRGGYVPAKTSPFLVANTESKAKLEDLRNEFRQSLPSTGNGFTKERVEYNKPLSLDLRLMTKHIDDTIRFAFVQPAIEDVFRILKNKDVSKRLQELDPTIMDDALMPWLNRSARQTTMIAGRFKGMDKFWSMVRRNTGVGIMFANIRNGLQQFTGYFPAMIKVGPSYLKSSLAQYVQNPMKFQEEIAELSPFMKERQFNQIFDVQDTLNQLLINPNEFQKVQKWAERHGYFMQQAFQNQVDTVVWSATYNKVLTESPKTMSEIEVQKEAIQQADANVRLTQDSLQAEDLAAFQVGSPFYKTMVQFGGYFNMIANLNATQYKKLFNDLGWRGTKGQLFMTYLLGFGMPAFVADLIVRATGGDFDDEDEDGYLDDVAGWFLNSQFRSAAALIPFGNIAVVPFNALNDLPYDDRITTSPSVSTLEAGTIGSVRLAVNALDPDKEITGKNIKDLLTLITLATGIPFTSIGRPITVQWDINRGVIDPENTPDYIRALITGKASRKSRE